jgi:prepilin-type N-terminal cleavage/methylation domain-containing protein
MCGFTLIEMMVTIGIGAILLAITVSSYSDLRERTRVETANNFFIRLNEVTGRVSVVDTRINALMPHTTVPVTHPFFEGCSYHQTGNRLTGCDYFLA